MTVNNMIPREILELILILSIIGVIVMLTMLFYPYIKKWIYPFLKEKVDSSFKNEKPNINKKIKPNLKNKVEYIEKTYPNIINKVKSIKDKTHPIKNKINSFTKNKKSSNLDLKKNNKNDFSIVPKHGAKRFNEGLNKNLVNTNKNLDINHQKFENNRLKDKKEDKKIVHWIKNENTGLNDTNLNKNNELNNKDTKLDKGIDSDNNGKLNDNKIEKDNELSKDNKLKIDDKEKFDFVAKKWEEPMMKNHKDLVDNFKENNKLSKNYNPIPKKPKPKISFLTENMGEPLKKKNENNSLDYEPLNKNSNKQVKTSSLNNNLKNKTEKIENKLNNDFNKKMKTPKNSNKDDSSLHKNQLGKISVGKHVIFNYNNESYLSEILEIKHENIKVLYRGNHKWIQLSNIKKIL